jgi:hypothetical protein
MLEQIGVNKVLFETDWPHPTSLYPSVHAQIERTLSHVDDHTRRRVFQDNAGELYHLPDLTGATPPEIPHRGGLRHSVPQRPGDRPRGSGPFSEG